ncbi:hypothetical protein ACH5RR_017411 [Cinchona calisaya]|uniref:Transcription factor CBF/NF-Y/archaeal histone domain-containing protein n=1 Tax=Cinchona calisaya TaxID=153742 RepID=A0ABD2ZLF3_9GENT
MDSDCAVREQDRFMPIANVIRTMCKILPPHAKISDDAKETVQECPPPHFHLAHHPAAEFFGAVSVNGLLKDQSSNGCNQASAQAAAVANGEQQPFGQCKEQQ